jgi:hypothetical protein
MGRWPQLRRDKHSGRALVTSQIETPADGHRHPDLSRCVPCPASKDSMTPHDSPARRPAPPRLPSITSLVAMVTAEHDDARGLAAAQPPRCRRGAERDRR